jgi:hypothetical protein
MIQYSFMQQSSFYTTSGICNIFWKVEQDISSAGTVTQLLNSLKTLANFIHLHCQINLSSLLHAEKSQLSDRLPSLCIICAGKRTTGIFALKVPSVTVIQLVKKFSILMKLKTCHQTLPQFNWIRFTPSQCFISNVVYYLKHYKTNNSNFLNF